MSGILITNTMLSQFGKKGVIKPDAYGYRRVVLGGFGICNESNIYYDAPAAVNAINTNSVMQRKLKKGMLFGEADHPDITGLNMEEALSRLCDIKVKYKSHNIRNLCILTDKYRDANGRFFTSVEGDVAPSQNQYGDDLERDFNDPYQNTAFSIRSILDTVRSTDTYRYISIPITWDRVGEPGIAYANKYFSQACETFQPFELNKFKCTDDVVNEVVYKVHKQGGTEDLNDIIILLQNSLRSKTTLPAFLK